MKKACSFLFCLLAVVLTKAQVTNNWRVSVERRDGKQIIFALERKQEQGKTVLYILNATDKIKITDIKKAGDSLFFNMPAFESSVRLKILTNGNITGIYIKGTATATQYWPLIGVANIQERFPANLGNAKNNITGKWDVSITRANGTIRKAVAEFTQNGNKLSGTFLTPSADYRYLDGIVTGDSLKLSSFDGDHVQLFEANIADENTIEGGVFYNGYTGKETWIAKRNENIELPTIDEPTSLREGDSTLNFSFKDLKGVPVSINGDKFKNKVIIVQLLGSWCANCLDETKFLSDYYNNNRSSGVEIIALAYELTTDVTRSRASLSKFQKLFNVQYPMLITGVAAGDEQKTEKTLPQLTAIKSFPTTLFIDRKGKVREIQTSFYGPSTGEYYTAYKKKFYETVDRLLNE